MILMSMSMFHLLCLCFAFCLSFLSVIFCVPQSYPPPAGTKIEPARTDPPFWEANVFCNVDARIPKYQFQYNLTELTNPNLIYRLGESDVTGPMNDDVVSGFVAVWPNVNITTYRYGSGAVGLCLAGQNTSIIIDSFPYCDMAVVSREIGPVATSATELANFEYKLGYQPMEVPVMTGSYNALGFEDAEIFFVNAQNPLRQVTLQQLDAVLSTTRNRGSPNQILTWDQLGVTDPNYYKQPINLYGATINNGFDVFVNRVILQGGNWYTANMNASATVFDVPAYVAADKFGLGFCGVSYLNQTGVPVDVNVLSLAWNSECALVKVSPQTVCSREWPLSRFIYFYANVPPYEGYLEPILYEYLNYLLSYEGQSRMRSAQGGVYYPLPYDTLMEIRSKYLVIHKPPTFVDGTGSAFFNHSSSCRSHTDHAYTTEIATKYF